MAQRSLPGRRSTPRLRTIYRRLVDRIPRRKPYISVGPTISSPTRTLYPVSDATSHPGIHRGDNTANLLGVASSWIVRGSLSPTRAGTNNAYTSANFVAGPTAGIELLNLGNTSEWISLPLAAPVTIAGTIIFSLYANESGSGSDAAINAVLERIDSTGAIVSEIARTTNAIELPTTSARIEITATPTSTAMDVGDRIRFRPFWDDAPTMVATGSGTITIAGNTPGGTGDTYVTFTEPLTFLTTEPTGTQLFLTSAAGPDVGANTELEAWTGRGGSATTAVTNTVTGWTAPIQMTATAGGTAVEWYTRTLNAFTLSGLVRVNLRVHESNASANASVRVEIAVCDADGTNVTVFGANNLLDTVSPGGASGSGTNATINGELLTSEAAVRGWIAGQDISVTAGQRLRVRVFADDSSNGAQGTGFTTTLTYNGPTGGASGDTWIQLPQTVTELVGATITGFWGLRNRIV